MSRVPTNRSSQAPKVGSGVSGGNPPTAEAQRVRDLIADRHSKNAVDLAKGLHKSCGTLESEILLLDAYQCRIEDLLKLGMEPEARALLKMVSERFPAARLKWMDLQREMWAADGQLDELVEPLRDPNLPLDTRNRIESFIRKRVHDLPALAGVSSLPPEHPLRESAAALVSALQAVTRGPVDDQILALPQVSRRNPLAPWKALVRAIACFYRQEDEACKKWLDVIANDSVAARLIPPLEAMLGLKAASEFRPAEQRLVAAVGGGSAALYPALAVLEKAFAAEKEKPLLEAARAAVAVCDRCRLEIRERLRQHITVRCLARGMSRQRIGSAIGTCRGDAYFHRLLATSFEHHQDWEGRAVAVSAWEEFRREAIKEKWFAANTPEDGVLSLHMAQMVERLPADLVDELAFEEPRRPKRGNGGLGSEDLLSAGALYERACHADPNPDAFHLWLQWAQKHRSSKVADNVAERWREAWARDVRPLLYLTESAENRGAYKKSLKYLEDAEELDRLNPEVHRTKLRLMFSAAMRHLRQGQPHLVQTEIERIEALQEVQEGELAALVTFLRRTCAALNRDFVAMEVRDQELVKLVGGIVPAFVFTKGLMKAANLDSRIPLKPLGATNFPAADLLAGVARACVLGNRVALALPLPTEWVGHLVAALSRPNCQVEISQLLVLGEAALLSQVEKLAYAVSTAGLASGGADSRFLFLRGRSLPQWALERRAGCFSVALELARRERNTELAGKILDQLPRGIGQNFGFGILDDPDLASRPMPPELLNQILAEEQENKQFPLSRLDQPPKYGAKLGPPLCNCPSCRAQRGERINDDEADEDLDLSEDENVFGEFEEALNVVEEFLETLSPRTARRVEEAIIRGELPEVASATILGNERPELSPPSPRKAKKTTANLSSPNQGDLF